MIVVELSGKSVYIPVTPTKASRVVVANNFVVVSSTAKGTGGAPLKLLFFESEPSEGEEVKAKCSGAIELTHKLGNPQSWAMPQRWQRFLRGLVHCIPG